MDPVLLKAAESAPVPIAFMVAVLLILRAVRAALEKRDTMAREMTERFLLELGRRDDLLQQISKSHDQSNKDTATTMRQGLAEATGAILVSAEELGASRTIMDKATAATDRLAIIVAELERGRSRRGA